MAGRTLLNGQRLLLLAVVLLFHTLRAAASECVTSSVSGISIREFNSTTRSAVNSSKDCFNSGNKTYQFTIGTPRTIKGISISNGIIHPSSIIYSYNETKWFDYRGNVTSLSGNTLEFRPPIFLKHLVVSLGPFSNGSQCLNATLSACNEDISPAVSFQRANNSLFYDSIRMVCNVQGQPNWNVAWKTTDGYMFPFKYIENSFSSSSDSHNSTLKITKQDLSKDGFKCRLHLPPCATIICMAWYPGSMRISNASKDLNIFPASPEELHIESTGARSAVATWKKPIKDYIMNYTMFEIIVLINNQEFRKYNVPTGDPESKLFRHVIENLTPCILYVVEISAVNYHGRSMRTRKNFTTTAGLVAVNLTVQNVTANSVLTSWTVDEQFGDNCIIHNASNFLINYRCMVSYLNSCREWREIYASKELRQKQILDLNPATDYQIFIKGITETNYFNVSSKVINFTLSEAPPGAVPQHFNVSKINSSAVSVTWEEIKKEQQHGQILHYKLIIYEKNALFLTQTIPAGILKASVIIGLQECTEYMFSLSGCNNAGCGPAVNASYGKIKATFSLSVSLDEANPHNISALVAATGNLSEEACITGYMIQYREMVADNWTEKSKNDLNRTVSLYGLKPFTAYVFRARLVGNASVGNWTDDIIIKTNEGIPSAVRNLHVNETSFNAVDITWGRPLQPNGVILSYVIVIHGIRTYNSSFYELVKLNISNQTQTEIGRLSPAALYNISIYAMNSKHHGLTRSASYETDALPPLQPLPLIINEDTSILRNVLVTATAVPTVNGPVKSYQIVVEQRMSNGNFVNLSKAILSYQEALSRNLSFYLAKIVQPFSGLKSFVIGDGKNQSGLYNAPLNQRYNYTIYIRATTEWRGRTLYSSTSSAYLNRYPIEERPLIVQNMNTPSSITIKLVPMGNKVQYIRIIIRKVDSSSAAEIPHPDTFADLNITVYSLSKRNNLALPYVTAELSKAYLESSGTFVIGDGKETIRSVTRKRRNAPANNRTTYFNGPLDPGSFYIVFFRAYHTDIIYFSSGWSSPISTENVPAKEEAPKGTIAGLIVGIVICILAIPFFICVGYMLWKRNRKAFEANYRFSTMELVKNDKNSHTRTFSDDTFDPNDSCGSFENMPLYELKYEIDAAHEPILLSDFTDCYDTMKGKEYAFDDEFNEISDRCSRQACEGSKEVNISLNREQEAIPFDDARVCIVNRTRDTSDYINAAFVDSYNVQNAYIATQIPVKETVEDFWEMVLEQNVRTIVMLTQAIDQDRRDLTDYWPMSVNFVFGNGDVVVESRDDVFDDCANTRSFIVSGREASPRIVHHFQFNEWPSKGIPNSIKDLLCFRDVVNQWHRGKSSPKVIQCSNGSGLTGTYIALDAILNIIGTSKTVDIFNYVSYLRTRKAKMVETDRQYEFIYEVVNEVLSKVDQNTEMTNQNVEELYQNLIATDPLTGLTGIQKLFRNLNRGQETESSMVKKLEGSKDINEYKNRYSFKMPQDSFRVRLPVDIVANQQSSDYINATLVSLNASSKFITTQAPFGITVNDFWTMVYCSKAEVIISLNGLEEGSVVFTQYWPGSKTSSATYGNLKISLELETTPFPCVIQRDFTLSEIADPDETTEVTQFHVLGWDDHDIPSSRFAILQLCQHLINNCMSEETPPLIIQCSDGFGRSGTFCVCLEVIKMLKSDGIADIQNITRVFKEKSKFFVENEAQFKFIFDIALNYACEK